MQCYPALMYAPTDSCRAAPNRPLVAESPVCGHASQHARAHAVAVAAADQDLSNATPRATHAGWTPDSCIAAAMASFGFILGSTSRFRARKPRSLLASILLRILGGRWALAVVIPSADGGCIFRIAIYAAATRFCGNCDGKRASLGCRWPLHYINYIAFCWSCCGPFSAMANMRFAPLPPLLCICAAHNSSADLRKHLLPPGRPGVLREARGTLRPSPHLS